MEYIGFFISLLAVIYLYFRQHSAASRPQEHPSRRMEQEDGEEDPLAEFIHTMKHEAKKKPAAPPAPPAVPKQAKPVRKRGSFPFGAIPPGKRSGKEAIKEPFTKPAAEANCQRAHSGGSPEEASSSLSFRQD